MLLPLLLHLTLISEQSCSTDLRLLSETLRQFQDYDVVYHFNNSHLDDLEYLLKTAEENQLNYLINYGRNEGTAQLLETQLQLHVFFLEEPYRLERYAVIKDLDLQNVVLVTSKTSITKKQQRNICKTEHLDKARAVFLLQIAEGKFSTCCYYCGRKKVTVRTIPNVKNCVKLEEFFSDFSDFGGYQFKIGYTIYHPFFYELMDGTHDFLGPESAILDVVKRSLNFEYTLIKFSGNSTYSVKDLLIEKVRLEEIDWAVGGISQTLMRTKTENLQFTRYIQFQGYMVTFEMNEDNRLFIGGLVQFWYVSNWSSLLLIIGGVLGIALVAKLSQKLSEKVGGSFAEYAIMTALYLVEQQSAKLKTSERQWKPYIKLLFLFWLFSCLYLLANYKSVQAYYLMTSQTGPNDIDALIKKGYRLEIEYDDFSNINRHCQYLPSKYCTSLLEEMHVFKGDVCGSIKHVLDDKVVLIQEEESLKYTALTLCDLSPGQRQSLKFVSASIIPNEWHAWPFKSAPYIGTFSRLFSRMESSGLLRYWYTKDTVVYNNFVNVKTQFRRENKSLSISNFAYPFGILIVGYLISLVVLLKEIHYSKPKSSVI